MNKTRLLKKMPFIVMLASFAFTTACGGSNNVTGQVDAPPSKSEKPPEPVTLNLLTGWKIADEDLQQIFVKPLAAKYPHITLNITSQSGNYNLNNLIATGEVPDLLIFGKDDMQRMLDLEVALDLNEQIRMQGFDLNQIDPTIVQSIKSYGKKGEIYALPYGMNYSALYYNKDLFDQFGVAYPTDGMKWDEVLDLAKKVTRTAGGVQYRGLETSLVYRLGSPLSLNRFDQATGKAKLNTEEWKKAYQIYHSIISIPGNAPQKKGWDDINPFLFDKTVAMNATLGLLHKMPEAAARGLNWDLATYPQYPEKPGVYFEVDGYFLFATTKSKHPKEAFQVISAALSEEAQLESSKRGMVVSPLTSKKVRDAFGTESEPLKGKNVQAIFKLRPAPIHGYLTKFDAEADKLIYSNSLKLYDNVDINTIIRETEEAINQKVASLGGM
ncbi:MAG: extracellular solute-binding protein family 1 [Paenibacillus sp.]|nr:extracellular solute-binding protein family 1 [Paenibacillus sp.]